MPAVGELGEMRQDEDHDESAARGLVLAVVGITLMGIGGWLAVVGAERVVDLLGVTGSVVGLTLVALATTSEFVALIPATLRRGLPELAVAGIIGSVIYNATVTLGVAALARPLQPTGVVTPAATAAGLAAAVGAVAWIRGRLGRGVGAELVAGYALYVWVLWR